MKEKLLNNLSLKLLSFVCAIVLWGTIVNVYDPATSVTLTGVSVTLLNSDSLTNKDYTYEVIDGSRISVYVSGPRSIVSEIKSTDIIATADLSKVTAYSDYVDIDVKLSKEGVSASAVELSPKTTAVKLNIENRVSSTFNIQLAVTGKPADGYVVTETKISPTTVKLTGSASMIATVDHVEAVYDISGATMDVNGIARLYVYDENDNEISNSKLEMSKTEVDFKATVLQTKTVEVKYGSQGDVAAGYKLTGLEPVSTTAVIAGTNDNLNSISSIVIPSAAIDVSNLSADKEFSIYISNYLSKNYILISENKLTVKAKVAAIAEKTFVLKPEIIKMNNLATGYEASLDDKNGVSVTLTGTQEILNTITESTLAPILDLKDLGVGNFSVILKLTVPDGAALKSSYEVKVTIKKTEPVSTVSTAEKPTASNMNIN